MISMEAYIVDTLLVYKQSNQAEETNDPTAIEESIAIGHPINTFYFLLNANKEGVEERAKLKPLLNKKLVIII